MLEIVTAIYKMARDFNIKYCPVASSQHSQKSLTPLRWNATKFPQNQSITNTYNLHLKISNTHNNPFPPISIYCWKSFEELTKTSQEFCMPSSVPLNCHVTKIVMNSDPQLSELYSVYQMCKIVIFKTATNCKNINKIVKNFKIAYAHQSAYFRISRIRMAIPS